MPLYQYVKAAPAVYRPHKKPVAISFALMGVGGGILIWVLWPIISFAAMSDNLFLKTITPIGDVQTIVKSGPVSPVIYAASATDGLVGTGTDNTTNANAWYPTAPQKHVTTSVTTYTLSVPKLKIKRAIVTISGDDLNDSLVHYGGTGLPGQFGTAVVFGHSTLPQFYSPTNYESIFSLLPTLKVGDEILVNFDGVEYRYEIFEMVVSEPNDLSVLEQRFDDSYLTLVTCVPPGTLWKRLNVKAKLTTI